MDGDEVDSHSSLVKPLPTAFKTAGVVVLLFIWWQEACNCALRKKIKAPNPKGWPIFGNMLLNGVHLLLCNYIKNHGKVFSFNMFGKPSLVIADPDILKKILVKDFWNFRNRFAVIKPKGAIAKSVFLERDEAWRRIRATLTPSFSAKKMKGMVSLIEDSFERLMQKLEGVVNTGKWGYYLN